MGSAVLTNQSKWWLCCLVSLFQLLDSLYLEFQHQAVPLQTTMTTLEITMIQPETFQVITMILLETTLALEITIILILPETIQEITMMHQEITLALEIIMILLGTTLALEITMILLGTTLALEITMILLETSLALEITMMLLETFQEITMMLPEPEIMMGMLFLVELPILPCAKVFDI